MSTKTKTLQESVSEIVNCEPILDNLCYLQVRWADESEYEDWADYEESMKEVFNTHFPDHTFIKGLKRPTGMVIKIANSTIKVFIKFRGNSVCLRAESYK